MSESQETALSLLADHLQKPVLSICHDQEVDEGFDYTCLSLVTQLLPEISSRSEIAVLIDSPGGDIESAYRIMIAIRRFATDVEMLVPNWAKSAATFFCLCGNVISMGPRGELGPLDIQLPDPGGSIRQRSPLETFKGLEHLRTYSLETLNSLILLLVRQAAMDVPNAIEQARPLFSSIVTPLYRQVNPHTLGEAGRYLAISEEYAVRAMSRWGYSNMNATTVRAIASRLVWNYPTHGFVIDFIEAQELGLNVREMDDKSVVFCENILADGGLTAVALPDGRVISSVISNHEQGLDRDAEDKSSDTAPAQT